MPRPKKHRHCYCEANATYYKPQGVPMWNLMEEVLDKDELEAIKLADLDDLSQEEAAESMKISRATFGRIVKSARYKIANALVNGYSLKINN